MTDIALVTAAVTPKPDGETGLLVDALAALGLAAILRPWPEPYGWADVPLVVTRTPWDYFERLEEFTAWADRVEEVTHLQNPAAVLRWNGHKSYLLDLDRAGVPVLPTTWLRRGAGQDALAAALAGHDEVVIKPAVSVGAIDTVRAAAASDAARTHLRDLAARGDVLVQPFFPAVLESGETSLIFFDGRFSHAVRKRAAAGDYRVQDHHGGSVHAHEPSPAELAVASATLRATPAPTTYARIDLVDGPSGPTVMEAELIEPDLFLRADAAAPARFAACLAERLRLGPHGRAPGPQHL